MFSKKLLLCSISIAILSMAFLMTPEQSYAKANNDMGFSAGMAMPSGINPAAALPGSANFTSYSSVTFSYGASTSYFMMLSPELKLELGLGVASVSFSVPSGFTSLNSQTTISIMVGGKYFMMQGDVRPYLGAGISYTNLPKVTNQGTDYTGSLITFLACVGAEGFINSSKTVSLWIQMGIGFNSVSSTTTVNGNSASSGASVINLGGSAFGGSIYF